ncbi:MAG: 4Fe-4S dicluster domain-containing protein [Akkermansiaceae bacterium]|nr:4Fe-4S dicluster domain-containing protein [Akkermansiaceae bacterium]NNM29042.1 4Fe-4S dicluster domain-containing protein [Akkermansiaceae bacterium]
MLTDIDPQAHGPFGEPMTEAVRACVHCGFCLAACPTYGELGQEADTPRGRIVLMKEVLEGNLELEAALPHLDQCLGCLACEPACPSGVRYRDLISPFRALAQEKRRIGPLEKLRRRMVSATLPHPARFRAAATMAKLAAPVRTALPAKMRAMLELLPSSLPAAQTLAEVNPARGTRRARVALLAGCAQQVLDPDINAATIAVLTRNGVEVVVPKGQGCCGALSWHVGDREAAMGFARQNLAAFPDDVDAIVTNAAGCGSGMHEYPLILKGTADEDAARTFAPRVCDVSVFLDRLGDLEEVPDSGETVRVAYHDACHLSNGQGVRAEPRRLLKRIPGLELVEIRHGHLCCGSAGTYNIDQPDIAASLGRKKAEAVVATGAPVVASGNIGCTTQLQAHLLRLGADVAVRHTVQILRDGYRGGAA